MSILQRLFNTSPTRDAQAVSDKQGREYWIVWDDDEETPYVYLWHYGRVIGQVKLLWNHPELQLADINIFKPEHRGNGVGSALLQQVIAYARRHGAQTISGWIADHDAKASPYLFDWYRRHDFQVTLERADISVAKIRLDLATKSIMDP